MNRTAHGAVHRLALNESPHPPLPSVRAAIERTAINRYPDFYPDRLVDLIAGHHGVSPDAVAVGSGSVGVALQLLRAIARPGWRVVYAWPNFDGYPLLAQAVGAVATPIPLNSAGQQDLEALGQAVDEHTMALFLCNPHNPTGTLITANMLSALLRQIPPDVVVVLDEAYVEFVRDAGLPDSLALLRRHPNLLVLRTFSKAYGLAALRVGYGLGSPALIARVRAQQLPYGINAFAAVAVEESLRAGAELAQRVSEIVTERDRLAQHLERSGWRVMPSHANFLWLAEPDRIARCRAALQNAGIVARHHPGAGTRLTIGDAAANNAVLAALTNLTGST